MWKETDPGVWARVENGQTVALIRRYHDRGYIRYNTEIRSERGGYAKNLPSFRRAKNYAEIHLMKERGEIALLHSLGNVDTPSTRARASMGEGKVVE